MKKHSRFITDIPFLRKKTELRTCAKSGCTKHGEFKAPRTPDDVHDYIWFCLDHVREYNKSWNYFDGMDEAGMEDAIRRSTTWERPSWNFGTTKPPPYAKGQNPIDDPLGIFGGNDKGGGKDADASAQLALSPDERKAWTILGITPGEDEQRLKKRYKELVKIHHPDANGGSRKAEDRLKSINWAYGVLKKAFQHHG